MDKDDLPLQQVFHPFYIFQVCTVILWMLDSYEVYASAIIFITVVSICITVYETHKVFFPFSVLFLILWFHSFFMLALSVKNLDLSFQTEVSLKEVVSSNADQLVLVERGQGEAFSKFSFFLIICSSTSASSFFSQNLFQFPPRNWFPAI